MGYEFFVDQGSYWYGLFGFGILFSRFQSNFHLPFISLTSEIPSLSEDENFFLW